tara:strand:+ start:155 stop:256 length:102 start_codon:yes stop_codon:yes gene_type:complete
LAEKLKKQSRQERKEKEKEKERRPTAPFFIANY